jgi:hypothetical protein
VRTPGTICGVVMAQLLKMTVVGGVGVEAMFETANKFNNHEHKKINHSYHELFWIIDSIIILQMKPEASYFLIGI